MPGAPNKKATPRGGFLAFGVPDDVLLSRARCSLSSALRRFTVLFGMGRGGSTALWSSGMAGCSLAHRLPGAREGQFEEKIPRQSCCLAPPAGEAGGAIVGDDRLVLRRGTTRLRGCTTQESCELHRTTLRIKRCLSCKVIGSSLTGN